MKTSFQQHFLEFLGNSCYMGDIRHQHWPVQYYNVQLPRPGHWFTNLVIRSVGWADKASRVEIIDIQPASIMKPHCICSKPSFHRNERFIDRLCSVCMCVRKGCVTWPLVWPPNGINLHQNTTCTLVCGSHTKFTARVCWEKVLFGIRSSNWKLMSKNEDDKDTKRPPEPKRAWKHKKIFIVQ